MNNFKLFKLAPIFVVICIVGFSYYSQWCAGVTRLCYQSFIHKIIPYITYPAYFFALYLLPLTILLIFVRREVFNAWVKFALWAVPLCALFIASVQVSSMAYFEYYPFYRDDAARLAAVVLTIASLALMWWKTSRLAQGDAARS